MKSRSISFVSKLLLCGVSISLCNSASAQENTAVRNWAKHALGAEYGRYHFWQAPTHLFSVGTFFEKTQNAKTPLTTRIIYFEPNEAIGPGTSIPNQPLWLKKLVRVSNPVDLALDDTKARSLQANLGVKGLFKILGITLNGSKTSNIHTMITAGAIQTRQVDLNGYEKVIGARRLDRDLKHRIESLDFGVVQADIIVNNFTVEVDTTKDSSLTAKLEANLTNGVSATPGFDFSKKDTGKYKFTSSSPVVLATYIVYPNPNDRKDDDKDWIKLAATAKAIADPRYAGDARQPTPAVSSVATILPTR